MNKMSKIVLSIATIAITLTGAAQAVDWEEHKRKATEYDNTLKGRLGFDYTKDNSRPLTNWTRDSISDGGGHVAKGKLIDVCDQPGAEVTYPHCKLAKEKGESCESLGGVWRNDKCGFGTGGGGGTIISTYEAIGRVDTSHDCGVWPGLVYATKSGTEETLLGDYCPWGGTKVQLNRIDTDSGDEGAADHCKLIGICQ